VSVSDNYGVDWRDLVADKTSNLLAELRSVIKDPMCSATPDLTELRAAIDHAPRLVEQFLHLYGIHRNALERLMRYGSSTATDRLLANSAEAVVHDFCRDSNYFHDLEVAAEALRATEAYEPDDLRHAESETFSTRTASASSDALSRR
jgi:XRE family transcriptional regulator, fatty acid utilization regulator